MSYLSVETTEYSPLKANWGWTVAFGVLLCLAGGVALGAMTYATVTTVFIVGVLMVIGGFAEVLHGFAMRSWSKFFMWLLIGFLYIVGGFSVIQNPVFAAGFFTLLIGFSLIASGIARTYLALQMPDHAPLVTIIFSGVLSILVGIMVIVQWPVSSLWVIGAFLGVDLFFAGMSWIGLGLASRRA